MKNEVTNVLWLANLVRENIRAKQLFTPSNSILVTLSGGQDSLCSLLLLYLLQNQLGFDFRTQTKPALTTNSNFASLSLNLNFEPEWVYAYPWFRKPPKRAQTSDKKKSKVRPALTDLRSVVCEAKKGLAKGRVTIASHKTGSRRVMLLFVRAQPEAKAEHSIRITGLWIVQPRQLKSVCITRFTAVRDHSFSDINSKHKGACVQPAKTCDYKLRSSQVLLTFAKQKCAKLRSLLLRKSALSEAEQASKALSAEERVSKLEHYSPLGASVLLTPFYHPLTEQASDQTEKPASAIQNRLLLWPILRSGNSSFAYYIFAKMRVRPPRGLKSPPQKRKSSVNSDFYSATTNEILLDSTKLSFCLNPKGPRTYLKLPFSFRLLSFVTFAKQKFGHAKLCLLHPRPELRSVSPRRGLKSEKKFEHAKVTQAFVPVTRSGSEFGVLWCNHFWQRESFYTMLHVAKINFCFSSIICFYLPLKSVLSEQNAREWRHKSIQRTSAFYQYDCCTQAHTKSDRVETILFNIVRGTGIPGLQSLQWKKSFYSFSCQRFFPWATFAHFRRGLLRKPKRKCAKVARNPP